MSFHPAIVSLAPFSPPSYTELIALQAFQPNQIPEAMYEKMCREYQNIEDVKVERIVYMHEGLRVTGVIASSQHTARNADLVIYNRGGSGNYGILAVHTILRQFVPLARAGYIVAGSNYRGNDGGDGKDEFGGRDVDDVIALHNLMRAHPLVNDKPCFMMGHSRGGMMTYLLIKRGLAMRAAIALAAVSDLFSLVDFRPELLEKVYRRFIPDCNVEENTALASRSALFWPEALHIPLLLLHGMRDEAVPYAQSEALAARLQALNYPHELVLYENGNHALIRDWPDISERIQRWWKKYA